MKALSISGGGENGAITVGRLAQRNVDYQIGDGTSTGALMLIPALLRKWDKLIEAYTSVQNSDIVENSILDDKGKIKVLYTLYRVLTSFYTSKKSLGDSYNLRSKLDEIITIEDWKELQIKNKRAFVSAFSYTYLENVSFDSEQFGKYFQQFKTKIWQSASAPILMSVIEDTRYPWTTEWEQWGDGGITDSHKSVYLNEDFSSNIEELDLFLHVDRSKKYRREDIKNIIDLTKRVIYGAIRDNKNSDIQHLKSICEDKRIKLNVHYTPNEVLRENDHLMTFDKEFMTKLVGIGRELAFDKKYIDTFEI
jgi:hypothetical protein